MKVKIQLPSCHSDKIAGRPKLGADRESCQESNLSCSFSPFLPPISPIDPLIYHLPNLPQTLDSSPNFTICPFLSHFFFHNMDHMLHGSYATWTKCYYGPYAMFSSTPRTPLPSSASPATSIYIFGTTTQTTKAGAVTVILSRPALLHKTSHLDIGTDLKLFRYIF